MSEKLRESLPISKERLYKKYKKYMDCLDNKFNEKDAASVIFEIDPSSYDKKPLLFFLIIGLRSVKKEMKQILEAIV